MIWQMIETRRLEMARMSSIRHLRFHVGLHAGSALGVGGRGQSGPHRRRQCGHDAGM
jgi:hypothetical protein